MDKNQAKIFQRNTAVYHKFRPSVPIALLDFFSQLNGGLVPDVVVDLGCGTGLSTLPWLGRAKKVIGIEPSRDMIEMAKSNISDKETETSIEFLERTSDATMLPDSCADLITAASSLHWMELINTKQEILRILKPGGFFSYFAPYALPLTPFPEIDKTFTLFKSNLETYIKNTGSMPRMHTSEEMQKVFFTEDFSSHRLFYMHQPLLWSAGDYLGWVVSRGKMDTYLKDIDFPLIDQWNAFQKLVFHYFGKKEWTVYFTYKIVLLTKRK